VQYCSDTKHRRGLILPMERLVAVTHGEIAHLSLDATRVGMPAAAHAAPLRYLFKHTVAPRTQPLRGE
jgi:hypothetical protein